MAERKRSRNRWIWAFLGLVSFAGVAAPWLAPYDPSEQPDVLAGRLVPPLTVMAEIQLRGGRTMLAHEIERTADGLRFERLGESLTLPAEQITNLTASGVGHRRVYLLGSDLFSRDVLSRLLWGTRISLFIGATSIFLALTLGVLIGSLAALGGRLLDTLLMRLVDGLMAFPWIFLLIAMGAVLPPSQFTLIAILGGTGWMEVSRLVRAEIAALREREFVVAARALGASPTRILRRHLLPNALTPLVVDATLRIGVVILIESSLSYLGLGVQPPHASWGNMIADGRGGMFSSWWVAGFPATALISTVIALNIAGDVLREVLDPRAPSTATAET